MRIALLLCASLALLSPGRQEIDWKRDRIVLVNEREERGLVIEAFDPERVLLMRSAGSRDEIPRARIQRIEILRDRLAGFLKLRRPELSMSAEWSLVEDAQRVGLTRMARLQAYHVLTRDPEHERAHEFLGNRRSGQGWEWLKDGKWVGSARFDAMISDWRTRLVLESEHFRLETDCGLRRGLEVLFDLEALYVWWMTHLGPDLRPAEDVDEPDKERIVFEVYKDRDEVRFPEQTSQREPYYIASFLEPTKTPTLNTVRTYYTPSAPRPERMFELATESLVYSLLVLGKSLTRAVEPETRRPSLWVERGLGEWVAPHCSGKPGYVHIRPPFKGDFVLDSTTARLALETIHGPHPLTSGRTEVRELITLDDSSLQGLDSNVPMARARAASFVAYLIEADPQIRSGGKLRGSGRAALWRYLREVYGTGRVYASDAFDEGLGGDVEQLEDPWKAWTRAAVIQR